MCLLPLPNTNFNSLVYQKGIRYFDCGGCPECLRKRSNTWALRAVYEARDHVDNCMITLTYDNFAYDEYGRVIGELPVNRDLKVNQRDVQLFIKRLRKWYSSISNEKIKYIACAEYGARTYRAHYHVILFGVKFPDLHFYKKSKRGNPIYMSSKLTSLWSHGICTVDSIRVHSAVARYCTKYCAKSRSADTFMLCSQKIGFNGLWHDFNGKNYIIDGREYTVPRFIWEHYIVSKYQNRFRFLNNVPVLSPKYVNRNRDLSDFDIDYMFEYNQKQRSFYRKVRDRDSLYVKYLDYWSRKSALYDSLRLSARERILQLPDNKYHNYKVNALRCLDRRKLFDIPYIAPNSGCVSAYFRYLEKFSVFGWRNPLLSHLPAYSRPNRASDTKFCKKLVKFKSHKRFLPTFFDDPPFFVRFDQLNLLDFL